MMVQGERTAAHFVNRTVYGGYEVPVKAVGVLCSDGKRRTARITGEADTYFSIPAAVTVKGKTVSGFVTGFTHHNAPDYTDDLEFISIENRKNTALLPGIPSAMLDDGTLTLTETA